MELNKDLYYYLYVHPFSSFETSCYWWFVLKIVLFLLGYYGVINPLPVLVG